MIERDRLRGRGTRLRLRDGELPPEDGIPSSESDEMTRRSVELRLCEKGFSCYLARTLSWAASCETYRSLSCSCAAG